MDNPLWDYSLAVYDRPEVAAACLALQERCAADVNLVLYAGWLAQCGLQLGAPHLLQVEEAVGDWRESVVKPLRALRRDLRGFAPAADLREDVRALELRAERREQDLIYRCFEAAAPLPAGSPEPAANLAVVLRRSCPDTALWAPDFERLAAALAR